MLSVRLQDLLILCICAAVHVVYRHRRKRRLPLPPGLPKWPLVGNAFDMPLRNPHVYFKELGKRLGSKIIYLEAMGKPIIVLNDLTMAQELLDKRSALYSSRPTLPMLREVVGLTYYFASMPYGDEWRDHRRMFQQYFSEKCFPRIQERALEFLRKGLLPNLYEHPEDFDKHIFDCIGGLSISMTYGLPIERRHDPTVQYFEKALVDSTAVVAPVKFLVNAIPQLKYVPEWMPGAHFKRFGREVREELLEMMNRPYQESVDLIGIGAARESFISATLENCRDQSDFEQQALCAKETATQVFGAASDTTVSATMTFILAMLIYPRVQRLVQEEIDSVLGPDRLPELSDLSHLPYLSAVVKEVLRWNPSIPAGMPHLTTAEDTYNGYYIPKDCTIIPNSYAMLHDEDVFPNPTKFDPSRFINPDGSLRDDLLDPETVVSFGFGRRICPGRTIALSMLRLTAASILYLFDISPPLNDEGLPIDVQPEFPAESVVSAPLPFKCKFTPREGKDIENLLQEYSGNDPI
ncbi:O-methylsterigmatocystin oxidoreductase [Leucoagaricus sp. SymC.cos]|nr:O-methylsterigmatocystin oxidoreductase [Leucoagaricus sp. SymC.cos]